MERGKNMDTKTTIVFHGFLNLPALEKLALVNSINEYFDSMNREQIREANDKAFEELCADAAFECPCCGR